MGKKPKAIAEQISRDRRTIGRELERGTVKQVTSELEYLWIYKADAGQRVHQERGANKGRGLKIGHCHELAEYLEQKIVQEGFSPDAALNSGHAFEVRICTKTLYNYIGAGLFMGISNSDLPVKKEGKKRSYRPRQVALNNIKGRSIEDRPKEVNARKEAGHWEMDCVTSGRGSKACLLVLTERSSCKECIFKMKAQRQECVVEVIDRLERKYKTKFPERFKSFTMDNGCEFLCSTQLEASILHGQNHRTTVYYAHPYSAWERGSNEVANKLIRRFIPKGANISKYSHQDIRRIEHWMNNYPRRIFGYRTANEVYSKMTSVNSW
jgi:IS30 family transposase